MRNKVQKTGSRQQRVWGYELRCGFTLMEILVAMGIFMLASVLIAEIFVNTQRAQQRTRDTQQASTDARYLLEVLAREVRSGRINYNGYNSGLTSVENELHLVTATGAQLSFRHANHGDDGCGSGFTNNWAGCVQLRRTPAGQSLALDDWYTITSPALSVDSLTVFITPLTDTFPETCSDPDVAPPACAPDVQPQVTIALKTSTTNPKLIERRQAYVQTTVTSRHYAR